MNFSNFESGHFQKQNAEKDFSYNAFIPNTINLEWT